MGEYSANKIVPPELPISVNTGKHFLKYNRHEENSSRKLILEFFHAAPLEVRQLSVLSCLYKP